jgi:hypothetical protein
VRAEASGSEVGIGNSVKLDFHVEGVGNLSEFEPPELELEGFHVLGRIEASAPGRRTFTYDIAPQAVVSEIPAISFSFFSPGDGYRTVATAPIPLTVIGEPNKTGSGDTRSVPGENDIYGVKPVPEAEGDAGEKLAPGILVLVLLAPFVIAIALMTWLRKRALVGDDPRAARIAGARQALGAQLSRDGVDVTDAFSEYLAAHLDCATAAVISPGLRARLGEHGLPNDLAERVAKFLDGLVAARFGGAAPAESVATARALFDELEAAFEARRQR